MEWLTAVAGFAAVMAVLSGIVTILVQGVHKLIAARRSGLREMLSALHDDVLVHLDPNAPMLDQPAKSGGVSPAARRFSDHMMQNPAATGGRWAWARKTPLLNWFFSPHFEELSKVQYVEQMAKTPLGQRLADGDPENLRKNIKIAAHHFDAYGEAQGSYFKRRAKIVAAVVAFAFVAFGNVNAVRIYGHLVRNADSSATFVRAMNQQQFQAIADDAQRVQEGLIAPNAAPPPSDLPTGGLTTANDQIQHDIKGLNETLATVQQQVGSVDLSALPIGLDYFPFCEGPRGDDQTRCTRARDPIPDPRTAITALLGTASANASKTPNHLVSAPRSRVQAFFERMVSYDGAFWLVTAIATAGMLGLGAPFWFDIFRSISSTVNGTGAGGAPQKAMAATSTPGTQSTPRVGDAQDVESLTQTFLIAAGRDTALPPKTPPPGRRITAAT